MGGAVAVRVGVEFMVVIGGRKAAEVVAAEPLGASLRRYAW